MQIQNFGFEPRVNKLLTEYVQAITVTQTTEKKK